MGHAPKILIAIFAFHFEASRLHSGQVQGQLTRPKMSVVDSEMSVAQCL